MKLVAIMRVKNEIDLIAESLARLSDFADEIIIVDNGSTDGTREIYASYPKVVQVIDTVGFDEGRDKIMLLEAAKSRRPDWIIFLDADEIFEKNFTRAVAEKYMASKFNKIEFRLCHFWLNRRDCRFDGKYYLYSLQPLRSMWRDAPGTYFIDKKIHNQNIQGVKGKSYFSPYRLKHFGLINKQKILAKLELYKSVDQSDRSYAHLDPEQNFFTYHYREFNNHTINYLWILFLKYLGHALWLPAIIYYRIKKIV